MTEKLKVFFKYLNVDQMYKNKRYICLVFFSVMSGQDQYIPNVKNCIKKKRKKKKETNMKR